VSVMQSAELSDRVVPRLAKWSIAERAIDPRAIHQAFSHCSTISELASATVQTVRKLPGYQAAGVGLFLPDSAGRLRVAAEDRLVRARRLASSRRTAFVSRRHVQTRVPRSNHVALMVPLTTRERCVGVLEVAGPFDPLDSPLLDLDLIAWQAASTVLNLREKDALRSESQMLKEAAQLVPELFRSSSMASAVQKAMHACFNWTDGPVAAWLSLARTDELELLSTLGIRAPLRQLMLEENRFLSGWKPLRESRLAAARQAFSDLLGTPSVWAIAVEDALILGAGETHHAEASLELLRQMLRDLLPQVATMNKSRQFRRELDLSIASIAHELRGSVLGTKAAIDFALDAGGFASPENDLLHRSVDELQHLAELTEGLLQWTAGGVSLRLSPMDLAQVIADSVQASKLQAPGRTVTVKGARDVVVQGNYRHLRIAFGNLLRNALIYSPQDAPVAIDIEHNGDLVRVSIHDEGPGIDPQEQEAVFDPWVRGRVGRSAPGRGLGLFITKKIVTAHGGRIWFDSNPGGGTTFHVALFSGWGAGSDGEVAEDPCVY
jgi:signal transduction histidine kinase